MAGKTTTLRISGLMHPSRDRSSRRQDVSGVPAHKLWSWASPTPGDFAPDALRNLQMGGYAQVGRIGGRRHVYIIPESAERSTQKGCCRAASSKMLAIGRALMTAPPGAPRRAVVGLSPRIQQIFASSRTSTPRA
jgi:hypothetical protein